MLHDRIEIRNRGDDLGNDAVIRISLATGREILAFATRNLYAGDWDFGPTWNYLVSGDRPFLLDAGRRGMGLCLREMMEHEGVRPDDLGFILLSHGHEDHDGGLFELTQAAHLDIRAHDTYQVLTRVAPSQAPSSKVARYPASCWYCPMPEFFAQKHCLEYHKERGALKVTSVGLGDGVLGQGISVFHVPGHSPDCLALLIDNEVMLTGDSILPEITTHPTREAYFQGTKSVLPSHYSAAEQLYGLRAYIRSVKRLREVSHRLLNLAILPSHRLLSNGTWNLLNLGQRCDELIQHHIQRCSDIIALVGSEPKTPEEIAHEHFEPRLLKGFGINLAVNEVLSHCELLGRCGDVVWTDGKVLSTDRRGFESFIENIC